MEKFRGKVSSAQKLGARFILSSFIVLLLTMIFLVWRIKVLMNDFKKLSSLFKNAGNELVDEFSYESNSKIEEIDEIAKYLIYNSNQLFEKNNEIIEKSKLAAIGEITAQIMHEIATPITVLKNNSIKLSSNPDEKIATMGSQNVKMINRIVKIINTIKKGIYSSNEKMEKVQIKELIEEVHCSVHIKTSSFHAT